MKTRTEKLEDAMQTILENDKRDKELATLRATNAELLHALKRVVSSEYGPPREAWAASKAAKEAIANAERGISERSDL